MILRKLVLSILVSNAVYARKADLSNVMDIVPPENCEETSSCCEASIWNHIKQFSGNYHVRELLDSTPRMLERYYSFYNLYVHVQGDSRGVELQSAINSCFWGVVTVYLNALPAIEYEKGLLRAQHEFQQVVGWLEQAKGLSARSNWTIPRTPLYTNYPVILGLVERKDRCFGLPLRIYVYDTGNYSTGALFCSAGQWGVEVLFHMYLIRSDCRTLDPQEANLFFVPDYRACHYHLAPRANDKGITLGDDGVYSKVIINHKNKVRHAEYADNIFIHLLASLPHFQIKQGMDHVFLFSDQGFIVNFTNIFPSWRSYIPHSIFVTTEGLTPGCDDCFNPWKDLVIPGHLDLERINHIVSYNQPTWNRTLYFNFHGRIPQNHEYYENVTVREDIGRLAHLPNVSIGGFVENYFEIMGSSHFCLIPEGTSSWTNHLYEAFFAGCIPLIISDNFVLPFQNLIDWSTVSVRWPQNRVGLDLYSYVVAFVEDRRGVLEHMKARVDRMQCWFHFYLEQENKDANLCSPYYGLIHGLNERRRSPKHLWPPYWG